MQILAAIRSPFIRMGTDFANLSAVDLGREVVAALLARTGIDPAEIDEVIMGCVCQPVDAANIARVIALRAGIPKHVPAMTVNRNCASGLEAITTAAERIAAGRGSLYVVGGVDSMSQVPWLYRQSAIGKFIQLAKARSLGQKFSAAMNFRPADFSPLIGLKLGLTDPVSGLNMGETAEVLAREFGITRQMQDEFAVNSQLKAAGAGKFLADEVTPFFINGHVVDRDNGIRGDSSIDKLAKLKPVFDRKTGSVTAGNSSQITDGAVALLVASEQKAHELEKWYGISPIAQLRAYAYAGCDPKRMGLGPVHAIHKAQHLSGLRLQDADTVEINEAFAGQVLACLQALKEPSAAQHAGCDQALGEIPEHKLNPHGGAIALGHPVGATGARLVLTAMHTMHQGGGQKALVSLCIGGGQGAALWLEKME